MTVTAAQSKTADEAQTAIADFYRYSRSIGRIGNYMLVSSRPMEYYYSSTRDRFSFTWSNGPWVYTVAGPSIESLEQVIQALPF